MVLMFFMKGFTFISIIVGLAFCLIPAYMAENRMRSGPTWFFLALVFSPLICIIILATLDTNSPDPEAAEKYSQIGKLKAEFIQLYNANESILSSHDYFKDIWQGATGIRAFNYEQLDSALRTAKEVISEAKSNQSPEQA
ncbi:hypothetical protein [Motilimonas sp. KMU-193]|uniref:hypothetical protein n=1 Tax=Motilimonas sp. KMU-193 TaxID=3388668 RepID=UPI00396B1C13